MLYSLCQASKLYCQKRLTNMHYKSANGFDITNKSEFGEPDTVLHAKNVKLERHGLATVKQNSPVCKADLKMYSAKIVLKKSLNKVFFEIYSSTSVAEKDKRSLNQRKLIFQFARMERATLVCKTTDDLTNYRKEDNDRLEEGTPLQKPG